MEKSVAFIKRNYSALVLAYLGDSYFETLAREYLIADGDCVVSRLNVGIKRYITAVSQSKIVDILIPHMNETEMWFYKFGRNAKNTHHSRSADVGEYRRATGLEALYGYYYLSGNAERAREMFMRAVEELDSDKGDCNG